MIHQLQAAYQIEQDRILVRINTHAGEELRLWLTRRMVKNLFPHMIKACTELVSTLPQQASHDGADSRALTEFSKQESLRQADFQTPFDNQALTLPMGDEPLLATTVHIATSAGGTLRLGFEEKLPAGAKTRSFEVTLSPTLLHGLLHLLETALKQADWGLTLGEVEKHKNAQLLDAFATAEPPRYLN